MASNRRRLRKTAVAAAIVFALVRISGNAQIITLSDQNSLAQINVSSSAGMFNWSVDGQNQLNQQWFWLAVGNGGPTAINNLGPVSVTTASSRSLAAVYDNGSYGVEIDYLLTGSPLFTGHSDIGESISLYNHSGSAKTFHFYQYSDFNLDGNAGGDTITLQRNLRGNFYLADQQRPTATLSETVVTPGANHGEAALAGVTLAKLNGGLPVTLSDNLGTVGPGDVTWAFEWDVTVADGGSFLISKDKALTIHVPEASSLTMLSLGLAGVVVRRQRRSK